MADKGNAQAQVKEIIKQLEDGMQELFTTEKFKEYLRVMSRFPKYSPRNVQLIHMQMPDASLVAGYQAWQTKFGRFVKRGEAGIRILAPTPFTVKKEKQKLDPDTKQPVLGGDGLPLTEVVEERIPRFKVIPVFDVSQTDGKPLPELAEELPGDVRHYELFMEALTAVSPLPVVVEPMEDKDGYCRYGEKVAVREGMGETQTICAAVHEIGHAKLHDPTRMSEQEKEALGKKNNRTKEVEAESVSYVVCQYYGIETSPNSFGYIASWSRNMELKELNASLGTIRKTASDLIEGIDAKFRELAKERGIDLMEGREPTDIPIELSPPLPSRDDAILFVQDYLAFMYEMYEGENFFEGGLQTDQQFIDAAVESLMAGDTEKIENHLHDAYEEDDGGNTIGPDPGDLLGRLKRFKKLAEKEQTAEARPPVIEQPSPLEHDEQTVQAAFERLKPGDLLYLSGAEKPLQIVSIRESDVLFVAPELAVEIPQPHEHVLKALRENPKNRHLLELAAADLNPPEQAPPTPEKEYDLGFGHMGNGLTVWNRLEEKDGDYVTVAHIGPDRSVTFYDNAIPESVRAKIEHEARTSNPTISASQDTPVFNTPPEGREPEQTAPADPIQEADAFLDGIGGVGNLFGESTPPPPAQAAPADTEIMPDPAIGLSERDLYGYTDPDMLPLLAERALALFDADHTIYMLHPDNTEAMAFDRAEIEAHDGIFGIEAAEWQECREYRRMEAAQQETAKEAALLEGAGDAYGVYQLKDGDDLHYHRWTGLEQLKAERNTVDRANYSLVYSAPLESGASLENLYALHNRDDRPAGQEMRSMSISDVVVLRRNGVVSSHYVDKNETGFTELPSFLGLETLSTEGLTGYSRDGNTPEAERPIIPDGPSVAELEAQVNAGQTISLLDLAHAVNRERETSSNKAKPSILAQLNEGKKTAAQGEDAAKMAPKRDSERGV